VKPPSEVLFVAKLNPVTTDADLELIFSRFGQIKECAIIRDFKTGDSLNYAFIEFETEDAVLEAYEKMNNVLIDDRRIKVCLLLLSRCHLLCLSPLPSGGFLTVCRQALE
jgi:peptidyl-prolyl cis-trans isomerase-like 4